MKKVFIVFFLSFVCGLFSFAQHKDYNLSISGAVKDNMTQEAVQNCFLTLMLADSTVVDTVTTYKSQSSINGQWFDDSRFDLRITKPAKYLLRVEKEGYDTKYVPLDFQKMSLLSR